MAWFKQTEQKSPTSTESQTTTLPPVAPAAPVQACVAPVDQRHAPAAAATATAPTVSTASRVGRGITLRGEITGREDLCIDGVVEGTLRLDGVRVIIGATGRVHASVSAREIVVYGEVRGDLHAEERMEIGRSGSVQGNAAAKRIAIEDGAVFNGSIEVLRPDMVTRPGETARASRSAGRADARPDARPDARADARWGQQSVQPAPAAPSKAGVTEGADKPWRDETVTASDSLHESSGVK